MLLRGDVHNVLYVGLHRSNTHYTLDLMFHSSTTAYLGKHTFYSYHTEPNLCYNKYGMLSYLAPRNNQQSSDYANNQYPRIIIIIHLHLIIVNALTTPHVRDVHITQSLILLVGWSHTRGSLNNRAVFHLG